MVTSTILGPDGKPIDRGVLREPQTAHATQLQKEFAGHPSRGLTPSRLAAILEAAEQGDVIAQFELFEDMEEKDAHILAEMGKRRRAVTQLEFQVVPPPNPSARERKAAKALQEMLAEIDNFEDVLLDTTDAIGKGFVCQEIEWQQVGTTWLPKSLTHRPQTWFRLHRGFRQEIRLRDNSVEGAVLNPFGWIVHEHKARSGYLERASLFRTLVWPYLFKNYSVADLAEWLEIYGIPLRIGKYQTGAGDKEKATLLRALAQIGHNAAGIIPEGAEIELHATATGDAKAFELMIDWCERSQSKVILGATLTSQAGRGSNTNALGNVHDEVRKDLRDSDAKQLAPTITRDLLYPLAVLNGLAPDGLRRCPRFLINTSEPEDMKMFADALPKLVNLGFKIERKWAQEQVGIPEPEGEEDILATSAPAAPAAAAVDPAAAPVAAAKAQSPRSPFAVADAITARLERLAERGMGGLVDSLQRIVEGAGSFEELERALLVHFKDLPTDELADLMGQALELSHLVGRSSIDDLADDA